MLVLAPAACITSGIALSAAFDVFTRSIKFQLPGSSQIDVLILSSLFFHNSLLLMIGESKFSFWTNIRFTAVSLRQGILVLVLSSYKMRPRLRKKKIL